MAIFESSCGKKRVPGHIKFDSPTVDLCPGWYAFENSKSRISMAKKLIKFINMTEPFRFPAITGTNIDALLSYLDDSDHYVCPQRNSPREDFFILLAQTPNPTGCYCSPLEWSHPNSAKRSGTHGPYTNLSYLSICYDIESHAKCIEHQDINPELQ